MTQKGGRGGDNSAAAGVTERVDRRRQPVGVSGLVGNRAAFPAPRGPRDAGSNAGIKTPWPEVASESTLGDAALIQPR